ncbi:hypothetical protein HRI_004353400 [Hibiscus trionum]|uniref:Cyclin-like domain-containing protein n=1 Tax=Hibiscus trionum TaxID=183268 RepID=A0A9W7J558_HIBTR|nr:hypothetical protein HRI_004353400 [Hibiscus trionum]
MQQKQQEQIHPLFLLDALYCEEEEEDGVYAAEDLQELMTSSTSCNNGRNPVSPPLPLSDQDLFRSDQELLSMFSKETRIDPVDVRSFPVTARREAVEWMLKVCAFHGFTALTAVLAVNYLDRFLTSLRLQRDDGDDKNKPWMIHLVAVTCLSLAAKVEETHVPLLLDLQVDETKYVLEAKTIQRMELLILSTLKWRMHPITPLSFLNHIITRLGFNTLLHWEFLKRCEQLLLCVISDSRSIYYFPSVLAIATMMYVIDQQETVKECYKLIIDVSKRPQNKACPKKRKLIEMVPSSPSGVTDACRSAAASVPSSSPEPPFKKLSRAKEPDMHLPSLNPVFLNVLVAISPS